MMHIRPFAGITPVTGDRCYIDPQATVIGDVTLGDDVSFWPGAVARGDVNRIVIGASTNVQDGSVLHVTHDGRYTPGGRALEIGVGVTVGHKVVLHACTVGDYCLIGMGAVIMDDVVIGNEALIAAGSLVTPGKVIPERTLWAGSPARQIRELDDEAVEKLHYSADQYVILKDRYLSEADSG